MGAGGIRTYGKLIIRDKGMKNVDYSYLEWPFFDDSHRKMVEDLENWCEKNLHEINHQDVFSTCRHLVRSLGEAGWLRFCVPSGQNNRWGGVLDRLDSRSLCLLRETLARYDALADFSFAMQGLGSGAITLGGSDSLKDKYLPKVASGEAIAAFALSEPEAGSDVAALECSAVRDGDDYIINGKKTWISNGGIADFYCVFVRTDPTAGSRGISAFVVDADNPGLNIEEQIQVMSPHPLATLNFEQCRVPASQMLGKPNEGFKLAMRTLDIFRSSVAAAAIGFARKAMFEGAQYARGRKMFGQTLADFQLTQAAIGDMATEIDSSALLVYRSAWTRDVVQRTTTRETAMAKMAATEAAQRIIDRALQMFGGKGVCSNTPVERLYRDIRSLRIYEGATEVQKLIIARETFKQIAEMDAVAT